MVLLMYHSHFTRYTDTYGDLTKDFSFWYLGILYAHRNEDIVNYGPGIRGEDEGIQNGDSQMHPGTFIPRTKKVNETAHKSNATSVEDWKKREYSRLAQFAGMEDVEFSKWLLSATLSERKKVLRDYKKRKEKNQKWFEVFSLLYL